MLLSDRARSCYFLSDHHLHLYQSFPLHCSAAFLLMTFWVQSNTVLICKWLCIKTSWVFLKWLHHLTQLFKLCCSEARKVNLLLYKWSLSFWDSHFYCVHVVLDLLESSSLLLGFHTPSGLGEFQQKLSDLQFLVFFCRLQTRTSLPLIYPVDSEGR